MSDDRVWLRHRETGGYFNCPAGAVGAWADLGWAPAEDAPEDANPAVAENLAWQASLQQETKPAKSAKSGASATGSDKKE